MIRDLLIGLSGVAVAVPIVWLFARSRIAAPFSNVLQSYKLEINAGGKLEADLTLADGRTLSLEIDPSFVYDLSNALLNAASRMGAKRQGVLEVNPDDVKPKNPKRAAP